MTDYPGYWLVLDFGQGGGIPDTLHGPYGSRDEATRIADEMRADSRSRGRRDHYDPAHAEVVDDE